MLDPIPQFKAAAQHFVALIESVESRAEAIRPNGPFPWRAFDPRQEVRRQFCTEVAAALADVYLAGLALPDVEPEREEVADSMPLERISRIAGTIAQVLGDWGVYQSVIPAGPEAGEPWSVSLQDDLLDTYRDLGEGLDALSAGWPENDVVFGWRVGFWSHIGEHLVNALRVIHWHLAD